MTASLVAEAVGFAVGATWLVRDVSLAVAPGEVVALVGPNGAGKSTLLKLLAGDLPPAAGSIYLAGRTIGEYRTGELALRRAVLPQQTVIQFAFTAREVVDMGRHPRRGVDDEAVVVAALERTETAHLADRPYPSLSVGEQARVSLARILAQSTPILLLDEPTAALDLRHQQLVMHLLQQIARDGATVVVILHDLNLAAGFADRIAVMRDGHLVAVGTPTETLTERLLSDVFSYPIAVLAHPLHGSPLVLPIPNGSGEEPTPAASPSSVARALR